MSRKEAATAAPGLKAANAGITNKRQNGRKPLFWRENSINARRFLFRVCRVLLVVVVVVGVIVVVVFMCFIVFVVVI